MSMTTTTRTLAFSAAGLLSASALAQDNLSTPGNLPPSAGPTFPATAGVEAGVNYSYDASATTKFNGLSLGRSDASTLNLGVDTRFKVNDSWFIPLGLQSDNYFLGSVAGAPVPDDIHTLHLRTGLGWHWNDKWTFTAVAGPTLYRFNDIHTDDFGGSGGVMATFAQRPDLTWTFGIFASPDSDVPVLPMVGVHWQINDQYTLDVGIPKTRLTYHIDQQWALYTGLNMNGTTFRSGDDLGVRVNPKSADSQYDNALATYRDIRLGVGTSYELVHGLRAEVEVGYSVFHEIDYKDLNQQVHFNPAPYVRAGLSYRF